MPMAGRLNAMAPTVSAGKRSTATPAASRPAMVPKANSARTLPACPIVMPLSTRTSASCELVTTSGIETSTVTASRIRYRRSANNPRIPDTGPADSPRGLGRAVARRHQQDRGDTRRGRVDCSGHSGEAPSPRLDEPGKRCAGKCSDDGWCRYGNGKRHASTAIEGPNHDAQEDRPGGHRPERKLHYQNRNVVPDRAVEHGDCDIAARRRHHAQSADAADAEPVGKVTDYRIGQDRQAGHDTGHGELGLCPTHGRHKVGRQQVYHERMESHA